MLGDKGLVIYESEETHDELTIHPVRHSTMAGDGIAKVLDLEGAFEARCKEAAEGRDERGEGGEDHGVELHRLPGEGEGGALGQEEQVRQGIGVRQEGGVRLALEAGEDVGAEVVDGADEVLGAHQHVGQQETPDEGHAPGTNKTLDSLLGRQLDQLGAAKGDAADVGEDVVADDERGGQEEPDHALEDVVHDEVGLDDDEVEGHVGPGEVGELELEVACLEVGDEEDEADDVEHEADEAVVGGEGQQHAVDEHDMLEVVDDGLAVEEVHGGDEPVPVEALGGPQLARAAGHAGDGDDLLERHDLDDGDAGDDVDVAREERREEEADHDERPERADEEVGLLLFIFGWLRGGRGVIRLLNGGEGREKSQLLIGSVGGEGRGPERNGKGQRGE